MIEKRSVRFKIVLNLAQQDEDNAAEKLNMSRAQLQQEQVQLKQLQDYSAQYIADLSGKSTQVRASQLINYTSFIQRIHLLQQEQERKIMRAERLVEQTQSIWQQLYQKRKAIQDLIARYVSEEEAALDKKLQKEIDDLTTQKYSRQNNEN